MTAPEREHRPACATAGVRRATRAAGVDLPAHYTRRVAADGLALRGQLDLTRLGHGVVLHTAPDSNRQLPVVLGYAEDRWYRDSNRSTTSDVAVAAVPSGALAVAVG